MGQKHRPFYRIVVAKSSAGRGGSFIDIIGTYNPLTKPSTVTLDGDKSLEWLKNGAQPTETVAYLLKREGVLDKFFADRPNAKKDYKFLDKRTATMSVKSAVETPAAPVEEPKVEEPKAEAAPVVEEATAVETPAAPEEPSSTETTVTEEAAPSEEA